ncbi:MAG: hypothetical protein GF317_01970 [Candidatus Lokiarchaeota archaeon]|nr:hypothetical protein [Candidatus Lokiarchaeota archaeon]MBD3198708.1 hypothetical protein [Candidatus Lokiarchaeota archaeon]
MSSKNINVKDLANSFQNSIPELIKGFFIFVLSISGLIIAIILRSSGFDGYTISFVSIVIELISMTIVYILFKKYLKKEEKSQIRQKKGK